MDMEDQVREAVVEELTRQAEGSDGALRVSRENLATGRLAVAGSIDLDALAMAVVGSLAGGP
jgi:hypothetical protein